MCRCDRWGNGPKQKMQTYTFWGAREVTPLVITPEIDVLKILLCKGHCRAVDITKHCLETAPSEGM